jgi:hypothetical protein
MLFTETGTQTSYHSPLTAFSLAWADWFGVRPGDSTNVNVAPSRDYAGTALSVDTNCAAYVQLDVFQDGWTNIMFDSGLISLCFQPNWTSDTGAKRPPCALLAAPKRQARRLGQGMTD